MWIGDFVGGRRLMRTSAPIAVIASADFAARMPSHGNGQECDVPRLRVLLRHTRRWSTKSNSMSIISLPVGIPVNCQGRER